MIPGALTNQPPAGGSLAASKNTQGESDRVNKSTRAVRNYEIDRTLSHTRQSPVTLKRLSVAVIIDYRTSFTKKGKIERTPLDEEEIKRVTALVTEAVGLNNARGDTINVVNTPFQLPEAVEPLPELPLWEQAWVLSLAKQLLGGLLVLLIAFGILRPMLSNLSTRSEPASGEMLALPGGAEGEHLKSGEDQLTLSNQQPANGKQLLDVASSMVKADPKRVAQVLNSWVENDGQ